MIRTRLFIGMLCLLICNTISAQITIQTNRSDNNFYPSEQMNFKINSSEGGLATYKIHYQHILTPIRTGTIQLNANQDHWLDAFTIYEPNHVQCVVELNGHTGVCGAAFSPFNINSMDSIPNDFSNFWENQKQLLDAVPMNANIWLHEEHNHCKTYNMVLGNIEGRNVYGYVTIPNGEGPFPAVISVPPAGQAANSIISEKGFSEFCNAISVSISIHNYPLDQVVYGGYDHPNINIPEGNYFRYGVLGAIRAIDYIYSRSDFDQEHLAIHGTSQGGGLSMLVAGIDDRVDVAIMGTPALSNHSGLLYEKASGWPNFLINVAWQGGSLEDQLTVADAVRYYDAAHAVKLFDGPSFMSISYQDAIVQPSSSFAAFNQLKSEKKLMVHSINLGHQNPESFAFNRYKFLRRQWPVATANPPSPYATTDVWYDINAGSDQSLANVQDSVILQGITENNGVIHTEWPVRWEKLEGPGEVTFSNQWNRNTTAHFSQNGTYVLRFQADDKNTVDWERKFYTMMDAVKIVVGDENIIPQPQAIIFNDIPNKTTSDGPFQVQASSNSGLPLTFDIAGPASIEGNTVTLSGHSGTVTILANQSGNAYFLPAPVVQKSFVVEEVINPPVGCDAPINLALNKMAAQSGTQHDAGANLAVDGNTDGQLWGSFSVSNTDWVPNAWWEVDLGEMMDIDHINVWAREDCCSEFLADYHIFVSEVPFQSPDITFTMGTPVHDFYQADEAARPTQVDIGVQGRYIRVQLNGTAFINLAELEVMGCPITGNRSNENSKLTTQNSLEIYPNPVKNTLFVDYISSMTSDQVKLQVFNTQGALILEKEIQDKSALDLDLTHFESGMYYLILEEEGERLVRPFVKN